MLARVVIRDPAGEEHELGHGDIMGRLVTAALPLVDGRVSEAHAMVSLREGQFQLVALRGALSLAGEVLPQIELEPGQRIQLARGVEIEVMEVWLPETVLAVEGPGLPRQMLPGVASFVAETTVRLVRGWKEGSALYLWNTGDTWLARAPGGPVVVVSGGSRLVVGAFEVRLVDVPVHHAGPAPTRQRAAEALRIVSHFDAVHIHRDGRSTIALGGKPARLIAELASCGCPMGWAALAEAVWPEVEDDPVLHRTRFDTLLSRLRRKLRASGVRADLVSTDGAGMVSLLLNPQDTVEDRA